MVRWHIRAHRPLFTWCSKPIAPGVIVALFFRCMGVLLNPVDGKRGIKWGLVVHTVAMFLLVTIDCCMNFCLQWISYVDNREFLGDPSTPPGPFGYQIGFLYKTPMNTVAGIMSFLNMWLADGLLVSSASNLAVGISYLGYFPSSIVVGSYTSWTTVLWPCRV